MCDGCCDFTMQATDGKQLHCFCFVLFVAFRVGFIVSVTATYWCESHPLIKQQLIYVNKKAKREQQLTETHPCTLLRTVRIIY